MRIECSRGQALLALLLCAVSTCCVPGILGSSRVFATPPLGPPPAPPQIVPDNSLSIGEYVKLGVPPLNRPWTVEDYGAAYRGLAKLAKEDITKIPRYSSEMSGTLFERLGRFDELLVRIAADRSLSVEDRNEMMCQVHASDMAAVYADNTKQFDNEMVEFTLAFYRAGMAVKRLTEERLRTLPKDGPDWREAREELDGCTGSTGMIVFATAPRLALPPPYDSWRPGAWARYLAGLKGVLPEALSDVSPEHRKEFVMLLSAEMRATPHRPVRKAIAELLDVLAPPAPDNSAHQGFGSPSVPP